MPAVLLMRLAVLADTHLPDCDRSSQEAALRWALGQAVCLGADGIALAGDLTAAGEPGSMARLVGALEGARAPFVLTPGNADLRTPSHAATHRARLSQPAAQLCGDILVAGLDSADGGVSAPEKVRLEGLLRRQRPEGVVLVTHWPPGEWPSQDVEWLAGICARFPLELLVAGHKHRDEEGLFGSVPLHLVRGLDPEKAQGGSPALAMFVREGTRWRRRDCSWPECDPRTWDRIEREGLWRCLGISAMGRTLEDTAAAAALRIPVLEVRASDAATVPASALATAVAAWRSAGGRVLSCHLPDLRWDEARGAVAGTGALRDAVSLALRLGVDAVTVHVPRATVAAMASPGATAWCAMAEAFGGLLGPLESAGVRIGVENLHRSRGEPADERRGFGCIPPECQAWIRVLAGRLPGTRVGLLLDIGHARNNQPLAAVWTLGRWLAQTGSEVVGCHLHQVTAQGNHQPLHDPFGPTVSLGSLFWGWRSGTLAHGPLFLEIRPESATGSWLALRRFLETPETGAATNGRGLSAAFQSRESDA
ncbi:MAG: TIM barrel protein [Lentisphaeria bacterium]|nr:TIM barrel protein [Lentisphaeria bacterium]